MLPVSFAAHNSEKGHRVNSLKAFMIQENMIAAECASIFCISEDQIQAFVYILFVKNYGLPIRESFVRSVDYVASK
jgi:hypothetical protein